MKKRIKKLNLHRETITSLTRGGLREVAGGLSTNVTCGPTEISYCRVCGPKPIENY